MKKSMWRLCVASEFSAGHALRHYQGKCENMHGHNFSVEVTVEGEKLTEDTEFLLDFSVMKKNLKEILEALDHKILNETPPFTQVNPTSENLSRYIYEQMARMMPEQVSVYSVKVGEKAGQSATYYEVNA